MDTFIVVLALGIFIGFFIQTILGFGGALVALPILLYTMSLSEAIAYLSIFYMLSSIYLMRKEWEYIDKGLLKKMTLSSLIGVGIGILILSFAKPLLLKKALGLFIILYVVYKLKSNKSFTLHGNVQFILGLLGGFFSGLFSTGGPLYVVVVNASTPNVHTFRATMFGILALVTFARIPLLAIGGILETEQFVYSLQVLPFFIAALFLGKWAYKLINKVLLSKMIIVVLLISGIVLLIK
ncbi:sulfite exporter TauE/SafE family protein [Aquimarina sp. AU474]|uniref:sulfite exporter TauE/SafE family protein n=1 Tax=Aquimarina sp. AU474 TaxID=2108529 RepID=UPI000D68684F|nr:sulfite exporter TauE/SafE family protein [Aquimarina sp. AU474]